MADETIGEPLRIKGEFTAQLRGPAPDDQARYLYLRKREKFFRDIGWNLLADFYGRQATGLEVVKRDIKFPNLVVNGGKNYILDNALAGVAYTATEYFGIVDGGSAPVYSVNDTMSSHGGWTENQNYAAGTRPAANWGSASGGSKAIATLAVFAINSNAQTLAGIFMTSNSTKGGTTGILFSESNFTGGNIAANNGDTLSIGYSMSI